MTGRRYDVAKGRFLGGFLVSAFEAIALGIANNLDLLSTASIDVEEKVKRLWQTQKFTESSGTGVRASTRIPKIIPLGRQLFKP